MEGLYYFLLHFRNYGYRFISVIYSIFKGNNKFVAGGNNIFVILGSVEDIKNIFLIHSLVILVKHSETGRQ